MRLYLYLLVVLILRAVPLLSQPTLDRITFASGGRNGLGTLPTQFTIAEPFSGNRAIPNTPRNCAIVQIGAQVGFAGQVQQNCLVSIDPDKTLARNGVMLLPNPSSGQVRISVLNQQRQLRADVYNAQGGLLETIEFLPGSGILDLSEFPDGIYLIRLIDPAKGRLLGTSQMVKQ